MQQVVLRLGMCRGQAETNIRDHDKRTRRPQFVADPRPRYSCGSIDVGRYVRASHSVFPHSHFLGPSVSSFGPGSVEAHLALGGTLLFPVAD